MQHQEAHVRNQDRLDVFQSFLLANALKKARVPKIIKKYAKIGNSAPGLRIETSL